MAWLGREIMRHRRFQKHMFFFFCGGEVDPTKSLVMCVSASADSTLPWGESCNTHDASPHLFISFIPFLSIFTLLAWFPGLNCFVFSMMSIMWGKSWNILPWFRGTASSSGVAPNSTGDLGDLGMARLGKDTLDIVRVVKGAYLWISVEICGALYVFGYCKLCLHCACFSALWWTRIVAT